jgi:hypothetical protein
MSTLPPNIPSSAPQETFDDELAKLRAELERKRENLSVRDEALRHLNRQRDDLRVEIFALEERILNLLSAKIVLYLDQATVGLARLPTFMRLVDNEPKAKAAGANEK